VTRYSKRSIVGVSKSLTASAGCGVSARQQSAFALLRSFVQRRQSSPWQGRLVHWAVEHKGYRVDLQSGRLAGVGEWDSQRDGASATIDVKRYWIFANRTYPCPLLLANQLDGRLGCQHQIERQASVDGRDSHAGNLYPGVLAIAFLEFIMGLGAIYLGMIPNGFRDNGKASDLILGVALILVGFALIAHSVVVVVTTL